MFEAMAVFLQYVCPLQNIETKRLVTWMIQVHLNLQYGLILQVLGVGFMMLS